MHRISWIISDVCAMSWREHCAPIIAKVLADNADADDKTIRAALRDACPVARQAIRPYKIWCDEIQRQRTGEPTPKSAKAENAMSDLQGRCPRCFGQKGFAGPDGWDDCTECHGLGTTREERARQHRDARVRAAAPLLLEAAEAWETARELDSKSSGIVWADHGPEGEKARQDLRESYRHADNLVRVALAAARQEESK
jgi:hypothetical protein